MDFTATNPHKKVFIPLGLFITTLIALLLFTDNHTYAGGRPVGKKRLFIIAQASYFYNDSYWDNNGKKTFYDNNGKYSTLSFNLSAEYGLSRRVSFLASLPYYANYFHTSLSSTNVSSLGDASVGVSYYIANIAYRTFFSVQGNFLFPLYGNTATNTYGYGEVGANTQFIIAGDFNAGKKSFSFGVNSGLTQYFGSDAPFQVTFGGNIGMPISHKDVISLAETTALSFSRNTSFNALSPVPAKSFNYTELTLTAAHNFSRKKSLFISATRFIIGENIGIGNTLTAGFTYKF